MSDLTTIDLLRHGEPQGGQMFRGAQNDPLSPKGWEQMRTAVNGYHEWQTIVSSPLIRCADFARELASRLNLPLDIDAQFSEIRFGIWEGRSVAEIHENNPSALAQFWRNPINYPIPGGEPVDVFSQRIGGAWDKLIRTYQGQHVLLIAHGGVIRMILRQILEMPLQRLWCFEVPFASLSRIRHYRDPAAQPRLVFHNGRLT